MLHSSKRFLSNVELKLFKIFGNCSKQQWKAQLICFTLTVSISMLSELLLLEKHLAKQIYHNQNDFLVFEYLGDYNTPDVFR